MSSDVYFQFIGAVWDNLDEHDKQLYGETWKGYEQIFASVYQKYLEGNLNVVIQDLQTWTTERWLPYSFTDENFIDQTAVFTSSQDLSLGINLTDKYLLRFTIDGTSTYEVDVRGIDPVNTSVTEIVNAINTAVGFTFARGVFENTVIQLSSPTTGVNSSIEILVASDPVKDAGEFVLGLAIEERPLLIPEFPYVYKSDVDRLHSVPVFQDAIRDESVTASLTEGVDYEVVDQKNIAFVSPPPEKLWARRSLVDQENPWHNFGFLMDIYTPNSDRYVEILNGLWFAFWNGPTPENVQRALYLLFTLPTARENGEVVLVTSETIVTRGDNGAVRSFDIPNGLDSLVAVGDRVERFQPLVTGIDVFDKINKPGFIEDEIGRQGIQRFLTEDATTGTDPSTDESKALVMLEEHTFLPQIQVESFITPDINIGNVVTFLDAIKPLSKTYLFQILVGTFLDEIDFTENVGYELDIDVTPNVDSNQTTFAETSILDDYEENDNQDLDLDSDVLLFQESVEIEVLQGAITISIFVI
jgi:hypothetical protein